MGSLYTNANEVIDWLGEADVAFEMLAEALNY